jgi:cytidyltransferase-like protein
MVIGALRRGTRAVYAPASSAPDAQVTITAVSDFLDKLSPRGALPARLALLARPLVFTNGVFDILHRGHVSYLAQARALGASLVVGLNSDASARALGKGPQRPLNNELDRACAR